MTGEGSVIAALVREFPGWQITVRPAGLRLCGAYRQSEDGRHRRYVVAPTPGELLEKLRAIRQEEPCASS